MDRAAERTTKPGAPSSEEIFIDLIVIGSASKPAKCKDRFGRRSHKHLLGGLRNCRQWYPS
jgi:hypothetical protein